MVSLSASYIHIYGCLCACACFLEDAVKARIALVKAHGLVMVQSLQSTVEEIFGNMEKWLHERYLAEMKRYGTV